MKATINISLRVPADLGRMMRRAARLKELPLATFVRKAATAAAAEIVARDEQSKETAQKVAP